MRERSPCPRPCSLSGMLSAWGSGFPPDSRCTGRQTLSRVESLPPHPKGRPLVCLVETPGGGGGGGQQEHQSPHHCPGGAFLREGGATPGTRTTPTSSASPALPASPTAFPEQLLGELGGTSVSWRTEPLPPGTHSRACPVSVGEMHFPPHRLGPCLPPAGSGSWGGREKPGVSPGCCLTFLLQPIPWEMFSRGRVSPAHCLLHCKLTWIIPPENCKGLPRDERKEGEVALEWALGLLG